MYKLYFSILLFLGINILFASNVDSLKTELDKSDKASQIEILLKITTCYSVNYLDSAVIYANKTIELANELNRPSDKARAFKLLGSINFRKGNTNKTISYYQEALELFLEQGNFNEVGNIYNNLGMLHQHLGNNIESIKMLEKALLIFENSGNELLKTGPLINMGILHFRSGDYDNASSCYLRALYIAKKHNDYKSIANVTNNLGALYLEWNKYNKALEFYNESIYYRTLNEDYIGIATTNNNIGIVFEELGDYSTAIQYIIKGLEDRKKYGSNELLSSSLIKLGDVYSTWGKYDIALDYYHEAIEVEKTAKNKHNLANALAGIANIYSSTEIYGKALDFYFEANKYFEELNNKKEIAKTYCEIGFIYGAKLNDFKSANSYIELSEKLFNEIGSKAGLSVLYCNKGEILLLQKKTKKAIKYINKSISLNKHNNYQLYNCYQLIAEANILEKDFKSAAISLNKAIISKDSVLQDQNRLQTSKYETLILNQKKEQEIKLLTQRDSFQKLQLKKRRNIIVLISTSAFSLLILLIIAIYLYRRLTNTIKKSNKHQHEIVKQKEKLGDVNAELLKSKITTEKHSEFKSEFLANVGHELRTPLNAVIGYAKLMDSNNPSKSNIKYLENIIQASDNLLVIINDLLDFSKIEAGKMLVEKLPFNPVNIVTQAISKLHIYAEEKSNTLEIHIDPNIPEYVIGDKNHLSQILSNLISNAIKFSPINKPISIEMQSSIEGKNCIVTYIIADRGVGIDELQQEIIFESFMQVQNHSKNKYSGTGLGLSIVKRLIELQEGTITLESKVNEGTTFYVQIPYTISENSPAKTINIKDNNTELSSGSIDILLVEDNEINQELAKDTILSWGDMYHVDIAENGKLAIKALESKHYHVVLMDIQMPEMDGHETTIHIRNQMKSPINKIPIIGMTAHALQSEKDIALKNGMDDYIIKPFNPEKLKQTITYFVMK